MHAVGKLQRGNRSHAIQEEGIERHAMLLRQPLVDRIEAIGVVASHVRGRQHAHQQNRDAPLLQPGDHCVQVLLRLLG